MGLLSSDFDVLPGSLITGTSLGGTVSIDNSTLYMTVPATMTASAFARTQTLSFASRSLAIHVIKALGPSNGETAFGLHDAAVPNNSVHVFVEAAGFFAQRNTTTGSQTLGMAQPYSPAQHAFWMLSEAGGMIEVAASSDGEQWTQIGQTPTFFDVTNAYIDLAITVRSGNATRDDARFDDLTDCP